MSNTVLTIGHSTHPLPRFVELLQAHHVTAVCDVRSRPYSRANPQYNRETLKQSLRIAEIRYVFLGLELGARSEDPDCYMRGKVQYDRLAQTELFQQGLDRVGDGMRTYRIALVCAEREPLDCHRTILIAPQLIRRGIDVEHILGDGQTEAHDAAMERLMTRLQLAKHGSFATHSEMLEAAYRIQASHIAYTADGVTSADIQLPIGGLL